MSFSKLDAIGIVVIVGIVIAIANAANHPTNTATAPAPNATTTQTTPAPTEDQKFTDRIATQILCGLATNPDANPECVGLGFTTEQALKTELEMENSPGNRANWEAWLASAASGATTSEARLEVFAAETRKQGEQHADASRPFLHGTCQPNDEGEKSNKEVLERGCKDDQSRFQRDYWLALQGDHQAQENVAFCFKDDTPSATGLGYRWPCHRVAAPDETVMCAWYLIAASSGHPKSARSAETYGYVDECDKKPRPILVAR
jgi:hypothetical protein